MHANNLSICVPDKGCNKNCPYCVSIMTGKSSVNLDVWNKNIKKVRRLANIAGVTSISITGKGEPLLDLPFINMITTEFPDYPLELQTNGLLLLEKDTSIVELLSKWGINVIAISVDTITQLYQFKNVYEKIEKNGMISRVTINVTDMLPNPATSGWNFNKYIDACVELGIRQITFRNITKALFTERTPAHEWIEQHCENNDYYNTLMMQLNDDTRYRPPIRYLPYGAIVHSVKGISVTAFEHCIQDTSNNEDTRSLIWDEDGHVYTAWNTKASILF